MSSEMTAKTESRNEEKASESETADTCEESTAMEDTDVEDIRREDLHEGRQQAAESSTRKRKILLNMAAKLSKSPMHAMRKCT